MSAAQFDSLIAYLRKISGAPRDVEVTDGELLQRFAQLRDEAAFTALVKRHGPMVFGVCRQLLRDAHDAEDAFQAVFLVLARKAGAVGQPELLGNWLYGVAFRVSSDVRAGRQRRQTRERQGLDMDTTLGKSVVAGVGEGDDVAVIHEEIQKLPEKHRLALVLCILEGQTLAEAARRLKVAPGTVGSRLARARELLRGRLARRGLIFSAGGFATVLGQRTASAAVPAALIQSTVKAAVLVAAGKAAAGVVSAKAAALTQGVIKAMFVAKVKVVTAVLLTVGVVGTGTGTWAYQRYGPRPSATGDNLVALHAPPAGDQDKLHGRPDAKPRPREPEKTTIISGIVRDAEGKPLNGAEVFWLGIPLNKLGDDYVPRGQPQDYSSRHLARAVTGPDGSYSLQSSVPLEEYWTNVRVKAHGMGLAWKTYQAKQAPMEFALKPEIKIEGRLLTLNGLPAKGTRIECTELNPAGPDVVFADEQGRFSLGGMPTDSWAILKLKHSEFASEELTISTRDEKVPGELSPRFTHVMEPTMTLQGMVALQGSGKPLAGVRLELIRSVPVTFTVRVDGKAKRVKTYVADPPLYARTDEKGNYRLEGVAGPRQGFYSFRAFPSGDSGALSFSEIVRELPKAAKVIERNFTAPKGRVLRGRVVDLATGKPVAGAGVRFLLNTSLSSSFLTDEQGIFTLSAGLGKGWLVAEGPSPEYIRVDALGDGTKELREWFDMERFPHALTKVPAADEKEVEPLVLGVRKGVALELCAVRPDGNQATNVGYFCPGTHAHTQERGRFEKGVCRLIGCAPDRTYPAYFLEGETHLGAMVGLKSDGTSTKPLHIRLQPTGSVKGRIVHADGTPAGDREVKPFVWFGQDNDRPKGVVNVDPRTAHWPVFSAMSLEATRSVDSIKLPGDRGIGFSTPATSSPQGTFQCDNLIPGAVLYLTVKTQSGQALTLPVEPLKPGEVRDLGDIRLEKP